MATCSYLRLTIGSGTKLNSCEGVIQRFANLPFHLPVRGNLLKTVAWTLHGRTIDLHPESSLASSPALRFEGLRERLVRLTLSRFELERELEFEAYLAQIGLASLFSGDLADFGGMTKYRRNFVSKFLRLAAV